MKTNQEEINEHKTQSSKLQLYKIHYGNYIYKHDDVLEFESKEEAEEYAYGLAIEVCDNSEGFRGFPSRKEMAEDDPGMTEEELNEWWKQELEDQAIYWVELYDGEDDE